MARELDRDELIERWMLIGDDLERVATKRSAANLGFASLLKFFAAHGRLPRRCSELPSAAVEFVAKQLRVPASDLRFYDWSGRGIERDRAGICEALGVRACSVADADKLTDWADRLACVRAGSRSAVWAPQGGDGQRQVRELRTLPDVENVALAPSQG